MVIHAKHVIENKDTISKMECVLKIVVSDTELINILESVNDVLKTFVALVLNQKKYAIIALLDITYSIISVIKTPVQFNHIYLPQIV